MKDRFSQFGFSPRAEKWLSQFQLSNAHLSELRRQYSQGGLSTAEVYRRITAGQGKKKSHSSAKNDSGLMK